MTKKQIDCLDRQIRYATPRKESVATAPNNDKPLKQKSQAEKDKQYKNKRKREFQQTWLIDFPRLRYEETLKTIKSLQKIPTVSRPKVRLKPFCR